MIKEFTSSTTQLYNKHLQYILLKAQLAKMEEHLQNIDPNELAQYNQNLFGQNLSQDDEENSQDDDEEEIDEEKDIEEDEIDEDESDEEESDENEDQDQDFRKVAPRYRKAPQQIQQLISDYQKPQHSGWVFFPIHLQYYILKKFLESQLDNLNQSLQLPCGLVLFTSFLLISQCSLNILFIPVLSGYLLSTQDEASCSHKYSLRLMPSIRCLATARLPALTAVGICSKICCWR